MERHNRRNGITGKPKNVSVAAVSENGGLAGLHRDLVEKDLNTELRKHGFDKVVLPHRDPARHQQDIVFQTLTDLGSQIIEAIPADTEDDWISTGFSDLCANSVRVAVSNLAGLRLFIHFNQFVASGNDG